ncbi:MAG: hypothetical protein HLUCCA08_11645 [Rhodobacteraceae bacterium HLUCCA08]|nr:MAG: hypothetical protein HLUCCA08_11645 [Rhodobacteraceae bacterium HLUCCA08]
MIRLGAGLVCAAIAGMAAAQDIAVPSGAEIALMEVVLEEAPAIARFRFLVPAIGGGLSFSDVAADFAVLCDDYALPALEAQQVQVEAIVISMSSRQIALGEIDPATPQFFEQFRPENGTCIWEKF